MCPHVSLVRTAWSFWVNGSEQAFRGRNDLQERFDDCVRSFENEDNEKPNPQEDAADEEEEEELRLGVPEESKVKVWQHGKWCCHAGHGFYFPCSPPSSDSEEDADDEEDEEEEESANDVEEQEVVTQSNVRMALLTRIPLPLLEGNDLIWT